MLSNLLHTMHHGVAVMQAVRDLHRAHSKHMQAQGGRWLVQPQCSVICLAGRAFSELSWVGCCVYILDTHDMTTCTQNAQKGKCGRVLQGCVRVRPYPELFQEYRPVASPSRHALPGRERAVDCRSDASVVSRAQTSDWRIELYMLQGQAPGSKCYLGGGCLVRAPLEPGWDSKHAPSPPCTPGTGR